MKLNIVINTDDKYLQHAMAMLCSLYENNRYHQIILHVLCKNLSDTAKNQINALSAKYDNQVLYYSVDEGKLLGVQFRKNRPLSMAAYYRLLLSSVLPQELEKVLYLDCDMIVLRDIQEIFGIELDGYALAATLDTFPYSQQHRLQLHMEVGERVFCSGIMMVNLKYWREHNVEPGLLEYAKRHREEVYLHDQDVLNYYFKKKWFLLPPKWNHTAGTLRCACHPEYMKFDRLEYAQAPMIYHYASVGIKPWYAVPTPEKDLYVYYLNMSGFQNAHFDEKPLGTRVRLTILTYKYKIKKKIQKVLIACPLTVNWGGVKSSNQTAAYGTYGTLQVELKLAA